MKWGRFLSPLFIASIFCAASAAAADRPIVAVFDIQAQQVRLTKTQRSLLTDLLATELARGGLYQVIPPGDIKRALMTEAQKSYKECVDQKCQIELGRQLSANKTLATTIVKLGGACRVTGTLYDLRRQATDTSEGDKCPCTEAGYTKGVEVVAAKLREFAGGAVTGVDIPDERTGAAAAPKGGDQEYKRALARAWRALAKSVRGGTDEQKLEKYQAFLVDFPENNPHAAKVQQNIDALEARLEKRAAAKRKAEEKQAALAAKRQRAQDLKQAYQQAKATTGSATAQLAAWEGFLKQYPDDNPYLKTAQRQIAGLRPRAENERPAQPPSDDTGLSPEAVQLRKDCDAGKLERCRELANKYYWGQGAPKDFEKSAALQKRACDGGSLDGCESWAHSHFTGVGVPKDLKKGQSILRKGCEAKHAKSCEQLGESLSGGTTEERQEALGLFEKSCDMGSDLGCLHAGGVHKRKAWRQPVEVNHRETRAAFEYFTKACDLGSMGACWELGLIYRDGGAIPQNTQKADDLYRKACRGGYEPACRYVKR